MDDDPSDTERLVTLTRTLVDQVDKIRLYVVIICAVQTLTLVTGLPEVIISIAALGIICAVQVLAFLGVVYAVTRT